MLTLAGSLLCAFGAYTLALGSAAAGRARMVHVLVGGASLAAGLALLPHDLGDTPGHWFRA